jgi:hypothetical protein
MFWIPHMLLYKMNTFVCAVQIYPTSTRQKKYKWSSKLCFILGFCRQLKRVHNEVIPRVLIVRLKAMAGDSCWTIQVLRFRVVSANF